LEGHTHSLKKSWEKFDPKVLRHLTRCRRRQRLPSNREPSISNPCHAGSGPMQMYAFLFLQISCWISRTESYRLDQFTDSGNAFLVLPGIGEDILPAQIQKFIDHFFACHCCQMIQASYTRCRSPKYLSSDHDPLYRFHQWEANLRVLGVMEIKTVPDTPWSHPFVD
jgi:hypothetical protein